ncbi:glycoside hydrolase 5 family protein [Prevotella veroralis]
MRSVKYFLLIICLVCAVSIKAQSFVTVKSGRLCRNDRPYTFIGTNYWYAAILGSTGKGGNRRRLNKELDELKRLGITNLRILVGSDGDDDSKWKVKPVLQTAPGVYNDSLLAGLDYLMLQLQARNMVAVLYLNNSWEWSGGYGFYLENAGAGKAVQPNVAGYPAYMKYASQFATNSKAQELFFNHVKFIVCRINRYTGKRYIDDPSIMSWQIGNEPRAFDKALLPAFEGWLSKAAALIKSLDKNHLVSVGSEGAWGCEDDYDAWQRICSDSNIDYCNIHIWPYNWGWAKQDSLTQHLKNAEAMSKEYIDRHLAICRQLNKPLVVEEFGYPRDGFSFSKKASTTARDAYYNFVFSLMKADVLKGGYFAGCNFWGWGGHAQPRHEQWQAGDDYTGDPAQEPQGLNSVFSTDKSTLKVIKTAITNQSK